MVLPRALFKLTFDGTAIEKLRTVFAALIATLLVMSEIDLIILEILVELENSNCQIVTDNMLGRQSTQAIGSQRHSVRSSTPPPKKSLSTTLLPANLFSSHHVGERSKNS